MSILSNPYAGAKQDAENYIKAVLDLLGDRPPLPVLEQLCPAIEELVKDVSEEQLGQDEAPGKWSIVAVVQHLADSELVWAYRLRLVVAQDRPVLTGFDQDRWAERLEYRKADFETALETLRVLRAANLRLLKSLTPDQLQRVGVHSERGEETIAHMLRLYAGHDLAHRRQLQRIRQRALAGR